MRRSLSAYVIRQPAFCRYETPEEFWRAALDITGGRPALIVVKLPDRFFDALATLAHIRGEVPVIEALTLNYGYWTGEWRQSVPLPDGRCEWVEWTPDGVDDQVRDAIRERCLQDITGLAEPRRFRRYGNERHSHPRRMED